MNGFILNMSLTEEPIGLLSVDNAHAYFTCAKIKLFTRIIGGNNNQTFDYLIIETLLPCHIMNHLSQKLKLLG